MVYAVAAAALRAGEPVESAHYHLRCAAKSGVLPLRDYSEAQRVLQIAETTGVQAAPLLDCLQFAMRQQAEARVLTDGALAGPAAAARMLVMLPVLAAVAGQVIGMGTLGILFGSALGWMMSLLGTALLLLGWLWTRTLVRRTWQACQLPVLARLELAAQLTASLLRSGLSIPQVLRTLGAFHATDQPQSSDQRSLLAWIRSRKSEPASRTDSSAFFTLASALEAGADPPTRVTSSDFVNEIWQTISQNWTLGRSVQPNLHLLVQALQRRRRQMIQELTARLGVWLTLPLALCFLPAFLCLAVVPAVFALLGAM